MLNKVKHLNVEILRPDSAGAQNDSKRFSLFLQSPYMFSMMAVANSLVLSLVAPSIIRSKS